jgi:hypothetical protein
MLSQQKSSSSRSSQRLAAPQSSLLFRYGVNFEASPFRRALSACDRARNLDHAIARLSFRDCGDTGTCDVLDRHVVSSRRRDRHAVHDAANEFSGGYLRGNERRIVQRRPRAYSHARMLSSEFQHCERCDVHVYRGDRGSVSPDVVSEPDADASSDGHGDGERNPNPIAVSYAHSDADAYAIADSEPNAHELTDPNGDPDADS